MVVEIDVLVTPKTVISILCSGSMKWKNGDRYDGEFVLGKREG